jgi:hypothetical protein
MRPAPTDRPLCVLVVDDCRDSADWLALLVQHWGYQTLVAYDGPAALDLSALAPYCSKRQVFKDCRGKHRMMKTRLSLLTKACSLAINE